MSTALPAFVNQDVQPRYFESRVADPSASRSFVDLRPRAINLFGVESWQRTALKAIASLGQLPQGWDGNGSIAPTEKVRQWCSTFILLAEIGTLSEPEFGPESGGAIQISWWSGYARELELHIYDNGQITYLKVQDGAAVSEGEFAFDDHVTSMELYTWLRRG
jgi:hypothetical protein